MRQQINLHQPIFRRERKTLSAMTVAAALGVIALSLSATTLFKARALQRVKTEVATLTAQQETQQAELAKVGHEFSQHARRADIETRVKTLTATLHERTQALQVLQSGAAGQTSGFASRMEALSRRHVNGLWIEALAMSGTHSAMSISGGSVDADMVPAYLRSLSGETVLSGTRFDDFVIERSDKGANVRFRAGSKSLPVKRPTAT